jgi:hypothetical protein
VNLTWNNKRLRSAPTDVHSVLIVDCDGPHVTGSASLHPYAEPLRRLGPPNYPVEKIINITDTDSKAHHTERVASVRGVWTSSLNFFKQMLDLEFKHFPSICLKKKLSYSESDEEDSQMLQHTVEVDGAQEGSSDEEHFASSEESIPRIVEATTVLTVRPCACRESSRQSEVFMLSNSSSNMRVDASDANHFLPHHALSVRSAAISSTAAAAPLKMQRQRLPAQPMPLLLLQLALLCLLFAVAGYISSCDALRTHAHPQRPRMVAKQRADRRPPPAAAAAPPTPSMLRTASLSEHQQLISWEWNDAIPQDIRTVESNRKRATSISTWQLRSADKSTPLTNAQQRSGHLLVTGTNSANELRMCHGSDQQCVKATRVRGLNTNRETSVWDLKGVQLDSFSEKDISTAGFTFRWSSAPITVQSAMVPPLIFSLFAEFEVLTVDLLKKNAASVEQHSVLLCEVNSIHDDTTECTVAHAVLPRNVPISLRVQTECDYAHILLYEAGTSSSIPVCRAATSLSKSVTLPALPKMPAESGTPGSFQPVLSDVEPLLANENAKQQGQQRKSSVSAGSSEAVFVSGTFEPALSGVDANLANGTAVRNALCEVYQQTRGFGWSNSYGWCDPSIDVCEWAHVVCSADGQHVQQLNLANVGLGPQFDGKVDLSASLSVLKDSLLQLDLSGNLNLYMRSLNLSTMANLQVLKLAYSPGSSSLLAKPQTLTLPFPSALRVLDVSVCSWDLDISTSNNLRELHISQYLKPVQLADLWYLSSLSVLDASASLLSNAEAAPDGSGLFGGPMLHYFLANLNSTHPNMTYLDLSNTILSWDRPLVSNTDTWPSINAPLLRFLSLQNLPQLKGGSFTPPVSGPFDQLWFARMPQLQSLFVGGNLNLVLSTAAFTMSIGNAPPPSALSVIQAVGTHFIGNLASDLINFRNLTSFTLDDSGIQSKLPQNIDAMWPHLGLFSCVACRLFGQYYGTRISKSRVSCLFYGSLAFVSGFGRSPDLIPSFSNLPYFTSLFLTQNFLSGEFPPNFLEGSYMIHDLNVQYKSVEHSSAQVHGHGLYSVM